ncbi:MAG: arginine beta-hydroxylase, Fe(II)/alpha-ketoglutarate-dependent [Nostoc sp. LLA-1]|nr:arginine beta-hydroxylase, Fe(II)/alpha-ketoglutarate-dependent [Cyanocohniella sp. LLY]
MERIFLSEKECSDIQSIIKNIACQYTSVEDPYFLQEVSVIAHELPRRIRRFLNDFRLLEPSSGICIISGYPISDEKIGKTPSHWKYRPEISPTLEEEILFILFSSLLGEVVGWSTQQAGHLVHDVLPIKGHEYEQLGSSSEELLTWHSEDAFHPYRGDYLGMMCLRNYERAATTVASIETIQLEPDEVQILFEPRFTIRPDESHLEKNKSDVKTLSNVSIDLLKSAYQQINQMNKNPEKIAVLYGDPQHPYIRIDPYFMGELKEDQQAQGILNKLIKAIDAKLIDMILQPGDFCFIDNFKAVHGRKPFKARYDGKDRWLKRVIITRDLRKSRSTRATCTSRIIF